MWPSRNQSQSIALSRHQPPSTHRPIHLIRPLICHQRSSEVIRGHQRSSEVISRTGPSISSDHSFVGRLAQPCTPSLVISRPSASTLRAAPRPTCGEGGVGAVVSTCSVSPPTWHSGAIKCNQVQSSTINCNHLPGGIRWHAEALSGVAIKCNQLQSSAITSQVAFGGRLKH